MVTCLAYCLDQELWKAIDYLKEQVRVLKEQQEKDRGSYTLWSNGLPIRGSRDGIPYPTRRRSRGRSFTIADQRIQPYHGQKGMSLSAPYTG